MLTNEIEAASNQDWRVAVLVRGTDNALYAKSQWAPNSNYGSFAYLGGVLK